MAEKKMSLSGGMEKGSEYLADSPDAAAMGGSDNAKNDRLWKHKVAKSHVPSKDSWTDEDFDAEWKTREDAMKKTEEDEVVRKYDLGKEMPTDDELAAEWRKREGAKGGSADTSGATSPEDERVDDPEAAAMGGFDRGTAGSSRMGRAEGERVDDPDAAAMGGFDRDRDAAGATSRARNFEDIDPSASRPTVARVFTPEASSFFGRMSQMGRSVASRIYEGVYNMPIANRIIGRLEIAYNQIWLNRHQKKAVQSKDQMDAVDLSINGLNQSKAEIEATIAELRRQGMPGAESLRLQLTRIDQSIRKELSRKDEIQSEFENRDNKMKLYANSRDVIADKLINYYDNKLRPMESELANLQANKDRLDTFATGMEVRHRGITERMADLENRKSRLAEAFSRSGMSERAIRRNDVIRLYDERIKAGHAIMQGEREDLARRRGVIDKRITKVDGASNPRRDRREEFVRIKESRPLDIAVETRSRGAGFEGREEARSRTREFSSGESETASAGAYEDIGAATSEGGERLGVGNLIDDWNAYLTGEYGASMTTGENAATIDLRNFLNETSLRLSNQLSFKELRKALEAYYKSTRNRNTRLAEIINRYFAE